MTHWLKALPIVLICAAACAQDAGESASHSDQPASKSEPERDDAKSGPDQDATPAIPGLDELLGIEHDANRPSDRPQTDQQLPVDPAQNELHRKLTAQEAQEEFEEAAQLMGDTAARLERSKDTGIQTQRLHEDILRKLDQVIAAAQEQQNQNRNQQQQQQPQQQQPQQQQQQQSREQQNPKPNPDNAHMAPELQQGELGPPKTASSAAWGRLPERTRDALVEGLSDRYSSLYERMTEAYYRRLAEDRP